MKIMHEQIDFPGQSTIKLKWGRLPNFSYPWHFHEEHEIVYVLESSGTRFVGDNIEPFKPGDLVMLAGNLPHYYRSDDVYFTNNSGYYVKRLVVHFPNDFLKQPVSNYPEFLTIKKVIERAERGIRFNSPESEKIGGMLLKLNGLRGFHQVMRFIEILYQMSRSNNYQLLASEAYQPGRYELTDDRLQKVVRFLAFNYHHSVSLAEVAEIAGMHPASFCRFFKVKTGKIFSAYLNELRIGFGCKLLIEGNLQISQICFEAGFNNLSNFNRTFKTITGMTPTHYQKQFLSEVKRI